MNSDLIDPPMNAAVNMARDRAILEMQSLKNPVPTLRIYRWSSPSVTIGYFQKLDETVNKYYCRKYGISITRRVTGGGTVLHHKELTYSFTLPVKKKMFLKQLKILSDTLLLQLSIQSNPYHLMQNTGR
jgi:lipoate-protein ligase A